jgi:hypothetical protein
MSRVFFLLSRYCLSLSDAWLGPLFVACHAADGFVGLPAHAYGEFG